MGNLLYEDLTYQIRGACFWVWKSFGSAFKGSVIDKALSEELKRRGLKIDRQKRIDVYYLNKKVGAYIPDIIVNDCILLELKRKPFLTKQDEQQFWHYLKGSPYRLGILTNFADDKLQIKRVIYSDVRYRHPR